MSIINVTVAKINDRAVILSALKVAVGALMVK